MTSPTLRATDPTRETDKVSAMRLTICGCVQGVGLRPVIARLAEQLHFAGDVYNTSAGVEVVLEGPCGALRSFAALLREHSPPKAKIRSIRHRGISVADRSGFRILPRSESGSLRTQVPRDCAICSRCVADISDVTDRRHEYPFTSCSDCGPRYSIIDTVPFERAATAMHQFQLCAKCLVEYTASANRRFHAQTITCPACGPQCWFSDVVGQVQAQGTVAVDLAVQAIRDGKIVALKGIGGYQLLTDATSEVAVSRLRLRKARPIKPLAVMVASLAAAESLAQLDETACQGLASSAGPVVVAPARPGALLAEGVHCGMGSIGLMLPTTPLHWLLARQCPPLVATSGNRESEPLAWEGADAECRLSGIADCFLHHDRPIRRAIDDSVVRIIANRPVTIRAARGIAPLPLKLNSRRQMPRQILAVGGQQKVAVALHNGFQAALGPHLGDLDELLTRERFAHYVQELCQLYEAKPEFLVHDAHPDYFTTCWAAAQGLPTLAVQHHHAHIVAGMVECGWLDREVLGVAWDGTGYGPDGTIWGGEFLRATAAGYQRVARLRPFSLIGGETAIREPWRGALAVLRDSLGAEQSLQFLAERGFQKTDLTLLLSLPQRLPYAPLTSSAGRLFDAVAAWLLPLEATERGRSQYEGHAAMLLEFACGESGGWSDEVDELPTHYQLSIVPGEPDELDWRPLMAAMVTDYRCGIAPALLARRFHAALADSIVRVSSRYGSLPVVLGGGVFQNCLLTEMIAGRFARRTQLLGLPGVIPPNDGGLAVGQLASAWARLSASNTTEAVGGFCDILQRE